MPVDTAAASRLQPGAIFGEYRIERLLGRGGMGAVYEATHLTDGRIVALKLLSVDLDQLDARQRFLREGRTAAAINHPNAVYIYGTEEIDGTPAIVMELVSGGTLEEKVKRDGPLDVQDAIEKVLQIIDGLDAALGVGVLHRDVKPSNCFVTADGAAKIGDFGLSKPVDSIEQHKLTQTGLFLGTPVYSSPEQLLGENLDERSDIYAVGVTFYYLLTGRLPFETGSLMQVMAAVLNGTPASMATAERPIPLHVQQVVLKSMARHAKDRYQTYHEFRDAVAALRAPEFRPATLWERLRAWLVDTIPLSYVVSAIVLFSYSLRGIVVDPNAMNRNWVVPTLTLVGMLFAIGVPEGLRGAGLGKWLLDIRVVDAHGRPIGIARSCIRVIMLSFASFGIVGTYTVVSNPLTAGITAAIVYLLGIAVPFVTARRHNGWRLLHDVVTKSRVVRMIPRPRQRKSDVDLRGAPQLHGTEADVGQYVALSDVPAHPGVTAGWDRAMQRRVWIAQPSINGELSDVRRGVSRLTRLRWTGGVRLDDARLDVFEAPTGEPLEERLKRPVAWPVMRNWLTDMLEEARAAEADGSWPVAASIDQLWVTNADEIVLTDALSPTADGSVARTPVQLMSELALLLSTRAHGAARPVHATQLLYTIQGAQTLADIDAALRDVLSRPVEVTRRRRIGPMVIIGGFAIIVGFFSRSVFVQIQESDASGSLADQLVDVINDRRGCSIEYTDDKRVRRCVSTESTADSARTGLQQLRSASKEAWNLLHLPIAAAMPTAPKSAEEAAEEKRLVEVYLVSRLADRVRDTTKREQAALGEKNATQARAILDKYATVDSADIARSNRLVDTVWQRRTPHHISEYNTFISYAVMTTLLVLAACGALLAALLLRRGLLLRGFQLDFVTADGRPASRLRLVARTILCWFVFVLPLAGLVVVSILPSSMHAATLLVVGLPWIALWIYGLATVIRHPTRGLPERLTGTYVVVE